MSYGRVKIYSDAKEITIDNVAREVGKAFVLHSKNRIDTEKLWRYYRGDTDIQNKKKHPLSHLERGCLIFYIIQFYLTQKNSTLSPTGPMQKPILAG